MTKTCPVCIDTISVNEVPEEDKKKHRKKIVLECNHDFHHECLSAWLKQSMTCPICRATVTQTFYQSKINKTIIHNTVIDNNYRPTRNIARNSTDHFLGYIIISWIICLLTIVMFGIFGEMLYNANKYYISMENNTNATHNQTGFDDQKYIKIDLFVFYLSFGLFSFVNILFRILAWKKKEFTNYGYIMNCSFAVDLTFAVICSSFLFTFMIINIISFEKAHQELSFNPMAKINLIVIFGIFELMVIINHLNSNCFGKKIENALANRFGNNVV
jgi:hypothetical protein